MAHALDDLSDQFAYLDDLRESGTTNMFGATPYLVAFMNMEVGRAREVLSLWMSSDLAASPEERAAAALGPLNASPKSREDQ